MNKPDLFDTWYPQLSGSFFFMVGAGSLYAFPEILDLGEMIPLELCRTIIEKYDFEKHNARARREGVFKGDSFMMVRVMN